MYCIHCGSAIPENRDSCPVCGNGVPAGQDQLQPHQAPPQYQYPNYQTPPPYMGYDAPLSKSRVAAGVLQILLGSFGAGRFYLGYTGIAVAQLLVSVFTCFIGSIWGLIDGILILSGDPKTDANGVPLRD